MNLTEKEPDRSGESFPLTSLRFCVVIETHRLALEDPLRSTLTFLGVALLAVLPFVDLPRLRRSGLGLESHDIAPFSEAAAALPARPLRRVFVYEGRLPPVQASRHPVGPPHNQYDHLRNALRSNFAMSVQPTAASPWGAPPARYSFLLFFHVNLVGLTRSQVVHHL